jgi:hypothetical protein
MAVNAVLYASCSVEAGAVLYADCSVAVGADTRVEGFADACYKGEKGVAEGVVLEGVVCREDKEGV